jgi:glycosyltransferase involved in cell wall biosynthesis
MLSDSELLLSITNEVSNTKDVDDLCMWDMIKLYPDKCSSNEEPLISVIMTHYNCVKYLSLSISSILNQTWKKLELIIIDDCSSKDREETDFVLDNFKEKDSRVRVFRNVRNIGCYVSKNIGILEAKGEYITFQDSDDFSVETRLEKQFLYCKKERVTMCYAKYVCRLTKLLKIAEITCFAHRDTFIKTFGCFDAVRIGADSELRHRAQKLSLKYGVVDEYLYACLDKWIENCGTRSTSLTQCHETSINSTLRQQYRSTYEQSSFDKYTLYQKFHYEVMKNTLSEKSLSNLFPREKDVLVVLKEYTYL